MMHPQTDRMAGKRVYIDTNVLIYFFNNDPKYSAAAHAFLQRCAERQIFGVVSELVVAEILVKPYRERNLDAVTRLKAFFAQKDFLHPASPLQNAPNFFIEAAQLAGERQLKLVDAMHLHTALAERCHFFLTQDSDFKSTASLEVVQLEQLMEQTLLLRL